MLLWKTWRLPVEDLRIEACYYENFVQFFNKLTEMTSAYEYDKDLIINVDETTTSADKTKRTTKVLYDPSIDIRPMARSMLLCAAPLLRLENH